MSSQAATNEQIDVAWLHKDGAIFNTVTGTFLWREPLDIYMIFRGTGAALHLHKDTAAEIDVVWEQCMATIAPN